MGFQDKRPETISMKPRFTVCIDVLPDNRVEVRNFPNNYKAALEVMLGGVARVSAHFIQLAQAGQIDKNGNIEKPMIVPASQVQAPQFGKH